MGPGRVYRNYTVEEGSYDVPRHRSLSTKHTLDSIGLAKSTRTFHSDTTRSDAQLSSSVGLTTDDDGITQYEEESAESDFHESRVAFNPMASPTLQIPALPDVKSPRGNVTSRGPDSQRKMSTGDDYPPSSPPPRASARPSFRPNYDTEETRRQIATISQDDNEGEGSSTNKMPDFFSLAVFQVVLRNPAIAHQLLKFGQTRLCGEHMEFLARVNKYHLLLHEVTKSMTGMYEEFFAEGASKYVNVPQSINNKVNKELKASISTTIPTLESVFASAQKDVERMIYGDIYPQFVRHQMSVSAAKALGGDRGKYAGLGDCFVLTDPSKADNPILFASDGFVKVTGHPRKEIIPRNCRFLQSPQTDREAVRRIKTAVDQREECVELLLNQKKNGEPFWNLLYVTPLFGNDGKLVFFLGGQINCSTTIHSTSDVLRILASSRNEDEDSRTSSSTTPKSPPGPSRSIRNPFGSTSRTSIQQRGPGMENHLIDRLSNLPLTTQFREFYGAYSNFIIVNYSTMLIAFVSGGIIDLLFPIKAKTAYNALAVGTDIFKFLGNHGSGSSVSWEFKSTVKNALKTGQAVSLELKLCAKPTMGFERFMLHWTPLKDEGGGVRWIVLTLGNEQRV